MNATNTHPPETLLPCPFCGNAPIINRIEQHTHSGLLKELGIPDHPGSVVIECMCGCGLLDATQEAVTARWNQRSGTDQDTTRLDWLADPGNTLAQVLLPADCVTKHLDSMRSAIDMAMAMAPVQPPKSED